MRYTIRIKDLQLTCIIGILDFERKTPQKVVIHAEIEYDDRYGFIDYAKITETIKKSMKKRKFHLIEDAHTYLQKKLKEKFSPIKSLKIKIEKPSILPDCRVSVEALKKFDS